MVSQRSISNLNLGPIVECNNCGKRGKWDDRVEDERYVRRLPPGWTFIENTYAGTVYFD